MKKPIYLLLLFVALAACKTKKTTTAPQEKQKTVDEATVADFATVLGMQKGDVFTKATTLLGQPSTSTKDKNDTYSFITCYYDDAAGDRMFSYTYDKKTNALNHFRITGNRLENFASTKAYFKEKKVNDFKVDFLGMDKNDIIKIMGAPTRVNSGNYEYVQGAVSITFICYDFHQNKCSEMYIFWNYYM
jgi:outer membrane protein assembly factor BamE (lipoprotein component of BamABCDE complex)